MEKSSLNKENLEVSLIFLCELHKNTLNMSLAKVVLFNLLRYSSICSQHPNALPTFQIESELTIFLCTCGSVVWHCVSSAKVVGLIPREHMD